MKKTARTLAVVALMCMLCTACHEPVPEVAWRQRVTRTPDGETVMDTVRFSDGSTANVNRLHSLQTAVLYDSCGHMTLRAGADSTGVEYHLYDYDSAGKVQRIIAYKDKGSRVPDAEQLRKSVSRVHNKNYKESRYEVYRHHYDKHGNLTAVTTRYKGDVKAAQYHRLEAVMKTTDKGRVYMEITQRPEDPEDTYHRTKRYDDFMLRYEAVYEDGVCRQVKLYRRAPSLPCGVTPALTCTLRYREGYNVYTRTDLKKLSKKVSWWKDGYRQKDEQYSQYGTLLSRTQYRYNTQHGTVTAMREKIDWKTKKTVPAGTQTTKVEERHRAEQAEMDMEKGTRPLVD